MKTRATAKAAAVKRVVLPAALALFTAGCACFLSASKAPPRLPEPVVSARSKEVTSLLARGPAVTRVTVDGVTVMGKPAATLLDTPVTITLTPSRGQPVSKTVKHDKELDSFRARFDGLPADTLCRYTVSVGRKTVGPFHFATAIAPGDPAPYRLAAYGDTQGPWQVHLSLAQQMLAHGPRLVLHAGDLCGFLDPEDPARDLRAHLPVLWTRGNHDFGAEHGKIFDIPRPWSSFESGSLRVLSLSSFDDWKPGSEQYAWFREQVERPWKGWTILLTHAPPFSVMGPQPNHAWIEHILPLALKGGTALIVCGHEHNYVRTRPIALKPDQRGVVQIITGGGGAPPYGFIKDLPFIATGKSTWHYVILDVTPRRITGQAIAPEGEVIDRFVIEKDGPQPDLILAPASPSETWRDARAAPAPGRKATP